MVLSKQFNETTSSFALMSTSPCCQHTFLWTYGYWSD